MRTRSEATFAATFTPEEDYSDSKVWQDRPRDTYSNAPMIHPIGIKVKIRLSGGPSGWVIEYINVEVTALNIKKDGQVGQRRITAYMYGSNCRLYQQNIEKALEAAREQFKILD